MSLPVDSINNLIAPARWKILESDDLPLLPDGSLRRYIDEVDRKHAQDIADYLRAYTDVANAASAKPYVDNPTIEGTVRTGRFRGGRVTVEELPTPRPDTPPVRIIQTLLWNCLETLPDEHARLVEMRALPANPITNKGDGHGNERWYTLRWANVAPDLAYSLAAGIGLTTSVTDKKYRKWDGSGTVTLTGTYYPVFGRAGTADDGSAFVEVLYAQSRFSVTVKDNLGIWNETNSLIHYGVPKVLAQGIINQWEADNPKGSRVNIDRAADTALCTITLTKRVYNADLLEDQITADNCDAKETTSVYWGLEEDELDAHEIPASGDIPAGTSWRRQVSNNGDGSFDIVLTKVETKLRDISAFTGFTDASQTTTVKQFKAVTDRVTQLGTYLDAPAVGQSRRWSMQKRDDCSEDWTVETTTVSSQAGSAYEDSAAESVATTTATQANSAISAPTASAGTIREVSSRPTDVGKYETTDRTRTAKDQTATSGQDSAAESVEEALHTQGTAVTAPPTATAGTIVEVDNEPTAFGKVRTRVRTRTAKSQTATSTTDSAAESVSEALATQASSALGAASASAGTIVENVNRPTPFGRVETIARTRTAKDQTATSGQDSAAESVEEALHTQGTAVTAPPTATAGTIVEVDNEPTAFGKVRTRVRTRTAKNQTGTEWEKTISKSTARTTATQATSAITEPTTPAAGVRVVKRSVPTAFGRYATEEVTESKVVDADSVTAFTATKRPEYTLTEQLFDGASSQPTLTEDYGDLNVKKVDGLWYGAKRVITYTSSYTANANWENVTSGPHSLGDDEDGRDIKITIMRGFTEAAVDDVFAATPPTGYSRVARAAGHTSYIRRYGPGQYEAQQVYKENT